MPKCPDCGTPNAYVGFREIECKNSKCDNFKVTEEKICPCCGVAGHESNYVAGADTSDSADVSVITIINTNNSAIEYITDIEQCNDCSDWG